MGSLSFLARRGSGAAPLAVAVAIGSTGALGCIQTSPIQPKALPELIAQAEEYPDGFYDTRTPKGKRVQIKGGLVGVDVKRKDGSLEQFITPITLTPNEKGDGFEITDRRSTQELAWADVRSVSVDATNPRGKRIALGSALLTLGAPFTIVGVVAMGVGLSGNLSLPENKTAVGVGAGFLVAGIALTIPVLMLIINPPEDPRKRNPFFPALKVEASGADIKGTF